MLDINVRRREGVVILTLDGDLMYGQGVAALREEVSRLLKAENTHFIFNLALIARMDSAGLGELIACYKRVRDNNGELKLYRPARRVLTLLKSANLDGVFEIFEDETRVIASFK